MNENFRDLHDQLLKGIDDCEKTHTEFRKHIECCFHICERMNLLVDKRLEVTTFPTEEEEILFYKKDKPQFTSLVVFYSTIYRAELFEPETAIEKLDFWKSELLRATQFLEDNREFIEYMKSGSTVKDKIFFLPSLHSEFNYQHLLAKIKANEMYIELISRKIPTE
jgi:hypothetical protein